LRVGFPHSEIPGSKLVCQLPGAYRRLQRPSSPVIAKASTTCTYSLDPITLSPRTHGPKLTATGELVFAAFKVLLSGLFTELMNKAGFALQMQRYNLTHPNPRACMSKQHPRLPADQDLYFFRIVKEHTADDFFLRRVHN
jgi:hypothetical protein